MNYLCPRHVVMVENNIDVAQSFWSSAMKNGDRALLSANWPLARSCFGAAYEIVLVRLAGDGLSLSAKFDFQRLADCSHLLVTALCQLNIFDEAERCLHLVHNTLLEASSDKRLTTEQRYSALQLVDEFLEKMVALLNLRGKLDSARSVRLISETVQADVLSQCVH